MCSDGFKIGLDVYRQRVSLNTEFLVVHAYIKWYFSNCHTTCPELGPHGIPTVPTVLYLMHTTQATRQLVGIPQISVGIYAPRHTCCLALFQQIVCGNSVHAASPTRTATTSGGKVCTCVSCNGVSRPLQQQVGHQVCGFQIVRRIV